MPDISDDPRIQVDLLRKERDYLKSDLKASQEQRDTAIQRLVKARTLLKRWIENFENQSGGIRDMDLGTREFLNTRFFSEEQ